MSIAKDLLLILIFLSSILLLITADINSTLMVCVLSVQLCYLIFIITRQHSLKNELKKEREYFIKTLSHDLRVSTLAQMRGLDILQKLMRGQEHSDLVTEINDSCRYTLEMMTMLVNTFRFENGENVLVYESIDTKKLLNDSLSIIEKSLSEKNIELFYKTDNLPKSFEADKNGMEKVFISLLLTAVINSVMNGKIFLNIKETAGNIVFNLSYTGRRLTDEECRRMFSKNPRFSTVGHGIRMHLCKKIIEFHGGEIKVQSHSNNVNTFTFTIPAAKNQISVKTTPNLTAQTSGY